MQWHLCLLFWPAIAFCVSWSDPSDAVMGLKVVKTALLRRSCLCIDLLEVMYSEAASLPSCRLFGPLEQSWCFLMSALQPKNMPLHLTCCSWYDRGSSPFPSTWSIKTDPSASWPIYAFWACVWCPCVQCVWPELPESLTKSNHEAVISGVLETSPDSQIFDPIFKKKKTFESRSFWGLLKECSCFFGLAPSVLSLSTILVAASSRTLHSPCPHIL